MKKFLHILKKKRKKKKKKKKGGKKMHAIIKLGLDTPKELISINSGAFLCRKVGAKNWGNKSKKK